MNIKIARSELLPTLNLISSVVERQQTLPILSNLYFSLSEKQLTIVGTDSAVEIAEILDGVEGEDCAFTISARKVLDICRMLPEAAMLDFASQGDHVVITSGRSRYSLKVLPAEDFPRIKTDLFEERFSISDLCLKRLLEKTSFAMALQDVRFFLNGLLLELSLNTLRATASDGHRLAQSEESIQLSVETLRQIIVPRKAVAEIHRFLAHADDSEVKCQITRNHLQLTRRNTTLVTLLIEGKFPEYNNVLETSMVAELTVNRNEILDIFNRSAILTSERFKGVRVRLSDGVLSVTANSPEHEMSVEEMSVDYTGEPIETGFNISYLIDATRVVGSQLAKLSFQGNEGILIIREPEDEVTVWLVMPLRL